MTDRQLLERLSEVRHDLNVIVANYFDASTHGEWEALYVEAASAKAEVDQLRREAYVRGLVRNPVYPN